MPGGTAGEIHIDIWHVSDGFKTTFIFLISQWEKIGKNSDTEWTHIARFLTEKLGWNKCPPHVWCVLMLTKIPYLITLKLWSMANLEHRIRSKDFLGFGCILGSFAVEFFCWSHLFEQQSVWGPSQCLPEYVFDTVERLSDLSESGLQVHVAAAEFCQDTVVASRERPHGRCRIS